MNQQTNAVKLGVRGSGTAKLELEVGIERVDRVMGHSWSIAII